MRHDTEPQTAAGKVLWHFTMWLDGFVVGPGHSMHFLAGAGALAGARLRAHPHP